MAIKSEFVDYSLELMQQGGLDSMSLRARAMFGGFGIYYDELMFALVADDELYFKIGDNNRARFESAGLPRFSYQRNGKRYDMSYARAPEMIFDDPAEMASWANAAIDAARAASHRNNRKR